MSGCGHPAKLVTVNRVGADGKSYESVQHAPCSCTVPQK